MAALYIAIVCPSGLNKALFRSGRHNVVARFLAGMCRDDEDHSHCYHELVKQLDDKIESDAMYEMIGGCSGRHNGGLLLLVHCVYECPSIIQSVNDKNIVGSCYVEPVVGFDWCVTGYCISHFNVEWGLSIEHATDENIELLVKGLRSSSTAKGKIEELHVHSSCKLLSQLKEFCQLHSLCLCSVSINKDDEVMLCQLIEHQGRLRRVGCVSTYLGEFKYNGTGSLFSLFLHLEELILHGTNIKLLYPNDPNFKKLTISQKVIQPLATLLPNLTSLTYLEIVNPVLDSDISVLITTVQSLHVLLLKVFYGVARDIIISHDLSELVTRKLP